MPNTPRLNLPYPLAEDPPDGPTQIGALASQLDSLTASDSQGTLASRPTAGLRGRYYYATDADVLYRDDGTVWRAVVVGDPGGVEVTHTGATWDLPNSAPKGTRATVKLVPSTWSSDGVGNAVYWQFRKIAEGASDWQFIGGAPLLAKYNGTLNATGTGLFFSLRPLVTIPYRGEYTVAVGAGRAGINVGTVYFRASVTDLTGIGVGNAVQTASLGIGTGAVFASIWSAWQHSLAANDAMRVYAGATNSVGATFDFPFVELIPAWIGP